ncbi:MAG: HAD family hydrolase, partial [Pseudomonadota bacterium]
DPAGLLRALCAALDVPWDEAMLSWAAGARPEDGVWGAHWYKSVVGSTGFAPPPGPPPEPAPHLQAIVTRARPSFERLRARKLTPI